MTAQIRQLLAQARASGDADAMLHAGAMALQAGADEEAIGPVRDALRRHPRHPQLWHLYALLHRDLQDLAASVEAFGRAAEIAPDDPMIAHGRACVAYEAGLPAARHFERAMRLNPSDRSILLRHAAALIAEGKSEEAIANIERALARDPRWLEGQAALARVRWVRGEQDGFDAGYEKAVAPHPREIALWRTWLEALLHDGLHERALAIVKRARAAAGQHPSFDAAEAIARSELGELAQADRLFAGLSNLNDISLIVHRLRHLLRAGRIAEAAALAEKHVHSDPTHNVWPHLSVAWRLLGDPRWEWLEGDPSFIGVYDLTDSLPPLDALAERLRALHRNVQHPLHQSVRGGTQTENDLFSRIEPEIVALRKAVVAAVERHVARLPPPQERHPLLLPKRAPIRFSGSWSVRLAGGGRHVDHYHPLGWISSALYIALPDEAERGEGEAGWLTLGEANILGLDLPPIRTIEPKPGRLILFPSYTWHGTRPFAGGERLAVAFDVKRPT